MDIMGRGAADFPEPVLPQWPEGFYPHQDSQLDSYEVQAILFPSGSSSESAPIVGLMAQLDRLAVKPSNQLSANTSDWQYTSVVRSNVFVDAADRTMTDEVMKTKGITDKAASLSHLQSVLPAQQLQRMSMGLAGVSDNTLWLGNNRLEILTPDASEREQMSTCYREYRWAHELMKSNTLQLQLHLDVCPKTQTLGSLLGWQQFSDQIKASMLVLDEQGNQVTTSMHGFAWLRNTWGNMPTSAGAVFIDTLKIYLDDQQWLDVTRSKRRSGRGPKTIAASLHEVDLPMKQINLEWKDGAEQQLAASGAAYPHEISLRSRDANIDIKINVMNRLAESVDFSGQRLHVPVVVSGSHEGAGFLSFYLQPSIQ